MTQGTHPPETASLLLSDISDLTIFAANFGDVTKNVSGTLNSYQFQCQNSVISFVNLSFSVLHSDTTEFSFIAVDSGAVTLQTIFILLQTSTATSSDLFTLCIPETTLEYATLSFHNSSTSLQNYTLIFPEEEFTFKESLASSIITSSTSLSLDNDTFSSTDTSFHSPHLSCPLISFTGQTLSITNMTISSLSFGCAFPIITYNPTSRRCNFVTVSN